MAQIAQTRLFRGFNTINTQASHNFVLFDIALINRDLSNAFNTRIGERVMRPSYGCKIWDYLMEPLTDNLRQLIIAEATRICQLDTRTNLIDLQIADFEQGIRIQLTLEYRPFGVIQTFTTDFENRQVLLANPSLAAF